MEFLPSDVDKRTDELIKQAAEREQRGDYPRAQDALQKIASSSTDGSLVAFANFNIGRLWAVQGDQKEAERSYRLAAENDPSFEPQVSLELGRIAEAGNRSEEAADLYRAATESGPEPQPAPATKRAPRRQRASAPSRAPEPQRDPAPQSVPEPQPAEAQATTAPPEETTGQTGAYENLITELSRHWTAGGSAGPPSAPSAGPAPAAAATGQPRPEAAASTGRPTAGAASPDVARPRARTPGDRPATPRGGAGTRTAAPSQPSDHPAPTDEQSELKPDALLMQPAEVEYMKRLAKLVATPRAAKRLLNTYRLLRASLTDAEHARFVPSPEGADHYMIVLVLLGVVVGFPNQAWPMFRSLVESERSDWWDFWGDLREDHGDEGPDPAAGAPAAASTDAHLRREEPGEVPSAARPDGPPSAAPRPFAVGGPGLDEQALEQVGATRRSPAALPEPATARQQAERREQAERADAQWERLFDVFDHLDAGDLPTSIDAFKYWAWKVSRYSFQTGRIAGLAALDAELP